MGKNFNIFVWSFASMTVGFLLAGGMALLEGANLWPLTAILGGGVGLIVGMIFGVIFKLINMPMRFAWCILGLLVFLAVCVGIYIKNYYTSDYGKLIEAYIVECKTSEHLFTPSYRNFNERREINGIELTLSVIKERKLEKFTDKRIKIYEWNKVEYIKTYFKKQNSCENMISGKKIILRVAGYGSGYEYVHRNRWGIDITARDGRFVVDR